MKRRELMLLLGGAAITLPLAARAQQPTRPVIGFLSGATFAPMQGFIVAFQQGLASAGFSDGRDLAIEYLWAEGHNERLPALAADLVHRDVAVIVAAASTPAALAAKAATETIPIVFFIGTDPVKVGLVTSLARPGGNITGVTALVVELIAKSLQLMHSLMPPATKIGVLLNRSNIPQSTAEIGIVQEAARTLGADIVILNASNPNEIGATFGTIVSEQVGALVVSGENFFLMQVRLMAELAGRHGVPTIYAYREFVHAGGLMSYGTHFTDAFRRIGVTTGRILKGEKAADLPVEQVTSIELAINLKTAKALGLTVPPSLLARADEVIE
jgi:putative ABC transport system substrate-binding protein